MRYGNDAANAADNSASFSSREPAACVTSVCVVIVRDAAKYDPKAAVYVL